MKIVMLGIDLGKNLCSLAGLDETGAVVFRRRMKRESVLQFTAQLESCTVAIEACCGAHHLGRQLIAQGACCSADVPRVCAALCEGPKERRARRGSDRRSSNTAYYEVCRGQERGAARSSVTPSCPRAIGW